MQANYLIDYWLKAMKLGQPDARDDEMLEAVSCCVDKRIHQSQLKRSLSEDLEADDDDSIKAVASSPPPRKKRSVESCGQSFSDPHPRAGDNSATSIQILSLQLVESSSTSDTVSNAGSLDSLFVGFPESWKSPVQHDLFNGWGPELYGND